MPRLQEFGPSERHPHSTTYVFWCPACVDHHTFTHYPDSSRGWSFNGDWDNPSFTPSLLYPDRRPVCHLFVTAGHIHYCGDCGHSLAGKAIPLPEIPAEHLFQGASNER